MPQLNLRGLIREVKKRDQPTDDTSVLATGDGVNKEGGSPQVDEKVENPYQQDDFLDTSSWQRRVFVTKSHSVQEIAASLEKAGSHNPPLEYTDDWEVQIVQDFLKTQLCERILTSLESPNIANKFVRVRGRRVLKLGGNVTEKGLVTNVASDPNSGGTIAAEVSPEDRYVGIPPILKKLNGLVGEMFFPSERSPNHVLVNHYLGGDGIMSHTDGPLYYPVVAILSLKSMIGGFEFSTKYPSGVSASNASSPKTICRVLLPANSLLLFRGRAYKEWLHGISPEKYDYCPRIGQMLGLKKFFKNTSDDAEENGSGDDTSTDSIATGTHPGLGLSSYLAASKSIQRGERYSLTMRYVSPVAQ